MKAKKEKKVKKTERAKYLKNAKEEGISSSWARKAYALKQLLNNG